MCTRSRGGAGIAGITLALLGGLAAWGARHGAEGAATPVPDTLWSSLLATGLIGAGILISARDFKKANQNPFEGASWRPCIAITGAVITFAALIQGGGLLPTLFVTVLITAHGSHQARLVPAVGLGLGVTAATWVVFVGLLRLPFKLLPGWP